ncbi:unnamed protein product [Notodromas monacha]|uniref:EF-hand domain-containing protein n=1 Tax=Notodromas monacha TaxID=399045 RepID=A0A7R9C1N7_9CRUS|nr:unnamed protein product [Notodromas monacha]CAG0924667.1 unnamed protein product [Notodromas monacha]
MSFEDFIDLASVFSEEADEKLKAAYVFQMFDFDENEAIGFADLEELVRRLTSSSKNSGLINPAFRSESDLARSSSQGKRIEKAVHEDALPKETLQKIVEQVLSQSVLGKAKEISYQEFVHLTSKLPDFASAFTIHF